MLRRPRIGFRRLRERLTRRANIAVENRTVFGYLVAVTAAIAVLTGLVAHVIDRRDFPTFGVGVWWSIVTLGTVGYGDVVPHTAWGRVLGGVVILFGVTFISFSVAIVTSMLVDANRAHIEAARDARDDEIHALLRTVDARLEAIEKGLGGARETRGP